MKKINLKITFILIIAAFAVFFGCIKKDKDVTPNVPHVDFQSNKTIKSLLGGYISGVDTIKEDWIIRGVVTANDESGNFYKTLYIQDDSAAINIQIDRTNMFNAFKVGQVVYVKLKDLCIGNYGGMVQIGYPYIDAGSLTCGRIPDIFVDDHLFRDGLPGDAPAPIAVSDFNTLNDSYKGKLVKLTDVSFETPCEPYSMDYSSTSNNVIDNHGNIIVLRTSNFANFRGKGLPLYKGNLIGIYSTYNGTKQFAIRDLNDVVFDSLCKSAFVNIVTEGFTSPPTQERPLGVFTQYSVLGSAIWAIGYHSPNYYATITGYYTGDANEDWLISPAVNMDLYYEESLIFSTATSYGNPANTFKLYWSNNYSGSGTPLAADWNEITGFPLSQSGFSWVSSTNIDFSAISGSRVYFAFKYTCSTTGVPTWEVTNIRLRGKKN